MFWFGLTVGLFLGATIGAVTMGCLVAGNRDDGTYSHHMDT